MNIPQTFAAALQHHKVGRLAEAEALYRQILAVEPQHAGAWHHLGLLASQMGRPELAVASIHKALTLAPSDPAAHGNLGEIYRTMGRLKDAVASFHRALEIAPDSPVIANNLGLALTAQGQLREAVGQFRRIIALLPDSAIAHHNLAGALCRLRQFDEAIAADRQAIALQPDYAEAWCNLGAALDEKGRKDEAIAAYRRALELKEDFPDACCNLGSALNDLGQYEEALAAYRQTLRFQPDHRFARYNLSLLLLLHEEFEQGWPLFESRWAALDYRPRPFPQPRWEGGPVEGRRLLIHAEQGFGDSIQFIRFAPLIAARGAEIIVECQPALVDLLRTVAGVREVVTMGEPLPPFDLHAPTLSLPLAFQTASKTIPHNVPYLSPDPTRRAEWQERLGPKASRFRVGLRWAGNLQNERLQKRHIPSNKLAPLLQVPDVDFFSLQLDAAAGRLQELPAPLAIIDHTGHIQNFADTAAFISELDLVISVDTAVAHLAGALGKPVWTLLPFVPDWRWGLKSDQTPWYPTMRLFRQPALGDWESCVSQVVAALKRVVELDRNPG